MSTENIQLKITLSDPKLDELEEERLQTDTENILSEIQDYLSIQNI